MSKISMLNVYLQHPVHFLALDVCKVSVWKKFSKQKKTTTADQWRLHIDFY